MTRTQRLTDIQLVLLSTAAQRFDGSLLPPPESLKGKASGIRKIVESLIKRGLVEERETADQITVWRTDGDLQFGAFISQSGRAAIGVDDSGKGSGDTVGEERTNATIAAEAPESSVPREGSKQALILGLMRRPEGATLEELVSATGWLPHTARAALTGLRKKGHTIDKTKRGDVVCYAIAQA